MSSAKAAGLVLLFSTLVVVVLSAATDAPLIERTSLSARPEPSRYPGDPFRYAANRHPGEGRGPISPAADSSRLPGEGRGPITPAGAFKAASLAIPADVSDLAKRNLLIPVEGITRAKLRDNFDERRGLRRHEALDIMAPRGTRVYAVDHGRVAKLFRSLAGGITVYQFDPNEKYVYYYAHLDRYAEGLAEGTILKRGDLVGYVGSTGNAPASAPHLHFTVFLLGPDKRWWKGDAVNPYPYLLAER